MIFSPLTPQATFEPHAFRPYEDHVHGRTWDEAAHPKMLPALMRILREFVARSSR